MAEFSKDMLLVLGRIVTILPLLLLITLYMGKRAIGQLPIFDFLVVVIMGAVVGADIADPDINHLPTALAIITIGVLQRIVAKGKITNQKVERLLTFEPTIIIQNGQFLDKNLRKVRYSINNIIEMLREKNIFDINEVETAIIEPTGNLSVLKKSMRFSLPVIVEGVISECVLDYFELDDIWLTQQLADQGVQDLTTVFFASIDRYLKLQVSLKDNDSIDLPPLKQ